jgi:hypothetical protein
LILYTPLPLELVLMSDDNSSPYQEVEYNGVTLVVQPMGIGLGKIVQVKSTDPSVYLRPELQPGQQISLSPKH